MGTKEITEGIIAFVSVLILGILLLVFMYKIKKKKISLNYKKMNRYQKNYTVFILIVAIIATGYVIVKNFMKPSIEKIKDSVVMIQIYDYDGELLASGSGFCAYQSDLIITNYHVVEDARTIKIITDDQKSYSGNKVLIFDSTNDLAIIQSSVKLKPLKIGSSKYIKTGKKVTTVGSPMYNLNTVSTGIISNSDRIQITAPISHGSSGGVLLDNKYRVIGVTYAGIDEGSNLGYAISIDKVNELKRRLDIRYNFGK